MGEALGSTPELPPMRDVHAELIGAFLKETQGFMFLAAGAPDDEQPFVYYVEGQGKDLDDTTKERLLQELYDTFRSPLE